MLKEMLVKFLRPRRAKRETDEEMFRAFAPLSSLRRAHRPGLPDRPNLQRRRRREILREIRN